MSTHLNESFQSVLNNIEDIIRVEHRNQSLIHLYDAGDYWAAFEKSAYFLNQVTSHCPLSVIYLIATPFPVVMVHIPKMKLQTLRNQLIVAEDEERHIAFSTAFSSLDYDDWHKKVIEGYY